MKLPAEDKMSIHRFIELTAQEGDLLSGFFSQKRAVEGTKGHSKVQVARVQKYSDRYEKEISVKTEFQNGDFALVLEGRVDGYYETFEESHIEEIKTVEGSAPESWEDCPILHKAQLICYAALWEKEVPRKLHLDLTYYNLFTGDEKTFTYKPVPNEIEDQFNTYLDRYFSRLEEMQLWLDQRDKSAEALEFPFADFRKGQRNFSVEVYRSLKEGELLLAQAPTGIGKTMGTIFPAVKAWGEGHIQRILYLTAKTTGRAMAEQALESLRDSGLLFTSVTLTAKDKICLSPQSSRCNGKECIYARGYFDKLRDVNSLKRTKALWLSEDFSELGRKYEICPFELAMEWGLSADVLIGDFNHLFDPLVSLKRFFIRDDRIAALLDEAHNLPDRSRDMYSVNISKSQILACRRIIKDDFPKLKKALSSINNLFLEMTKEIKDSGEDILMDPAVDSLGHDGLQESFRRAMTPLDEALRSQPEENIRSALLDLFFQLRFYNSLQELIKEDSHRTWISLDCQRGGKNDCTLHLYCLDPAPFIQESLEKCYSAVFFSATLNPPEYYENVFTIDKSIRKISIDSPFPPEHNLIINRVDLDTRYKQRDQSLEGIVDSIALLRKEYTGHQLVFFPSFAYMQQALDIWDVDTMGSYKAQQQFMSPEAREELIQNFDKKEPQLIFAVLGGIFAEGLDLEGDKLSALSVVSIALPSICLERELIKEHYQKKNGQGFDYAYRYPGWSRVLQASGRLIRSESDIGIIQLLGMRFSTPFYHNLYPGNWGSVKVARNIEENKIAIDSFKID